MGFEPTVPLRVHTPSKRAPSATRSSLQAEDSAAGSVATQWPGVGCGSLVAVQRPRGESGIRTHGAASGSTVFETARFDRSRISPRPGMGGGRRCTRLRGADQNPHPESSVPKRIRTSGLWIRNPMLYPAELWAHVTPRLPYVLAHCAHPAAASIHGLRRGGDSNPRYPFGVQRLSRAPDSATLAPLQFRRPPGQASIASNIPSTLLARVVPRGGGNMSGEGGIRTPGTAKRLNGFQDRLLRPLGHLSREQKTRTPLRANGKERQRISSCSPRPFTIPIDRSFVNKTGLLPAVPVPYPCATIPFATAGASPAISSPAGPR